MKALGEPAIRAAFLAACRAELGALKPGNVHIHGGGHGMVVADFDQAAVAAAHWIAAPRLGVGARTRRAVATSMAAVGCNTNLGILLLCVPLAAAALRSETESLAQRTRRVLAGLDQSDAAEVFAAIRIANPGGLGTSPEQDIAGEPSVGLVEAMRLAAGRDRIARAYVTDFDEIFAFGLPRLIDELSANSSETRATTALHMAFLASYPDSHIARKSGAETAAAVMREAAVLSRRWEPFGQAGAIAALLDFDRDLKSRGLNPGTTADFVVATLFAARLARELDDFVDV